MSTSITTAFIRQYEADVKHTFQRMGSYLKGCCRLKTDVNGYSTNFPRMGTGQATQKARHGVVAPMNVDHYTVQCTLVDRYAGDYVDKLDEFKTNIDERMLLAQTGAFACGRAVDSDIITALDGTTQTAHTITTDTYANTLKTFVHAVEKMYRNDIPNDGNIFAILPPRPYSALYTLEEFASADYVQANGLPLTDGMPVQMGWRSWMGVKWKVHTGCPGVGTSSSKGFIWHRTAVGYAMQPDISAEITYNGERVAHFVNHFFAGGAALIEDNGVLELTINDTTAIPAS